MLSPSTAGFGASLFPVPEEAVPECWVSVVIRPVYRGGAAPSMGGVTRYACRQTLAEPIAVRLAAGAAEGVGLVTAWNQLR
ncbi:hypothetical protein GCM10011512_09790 [Tersicoccus solisilvae]|uniref:Uncharacterized protein n=1 Tax=Tersicoccus solisilvae TaxID=1882339 RepID=A0ABQ1NTU4_9MICC|nr:hypothetical protein GCM10011512_09790 [Tersicoccus solisilvae]